MVRKQLIAMRKLKVTSGFRGGGHGGRENSLTACESIIPGITIFPPKSMTFSTSGYLDFKSWYFPTPMKMPSFTIKLSAEG
jgi:hypothetical protein